MHEITFSEQHKKFDTLDKLVYAKIRRATRRLVEDF